MTRNVTADLADQLWMDLETQDAAPATVLHEIRAACNARARRPLGALLIETGTLTVRQVAQLLRLQADEMHLRIGELAVRERMCDEEQVEFCLELQRESGLDPVRALISDPRTNKTSVAAALATYIHRLEGAVHNFEDQHQGVH
ncbi:MAG: hypothetical protein KDB80_09105 [Planctomycetes bacterium]|nr:hypothetical protein [Planctomycetota bacterium]